MAKIYARLVRAGQMQLAEVPALWRAAAEKLL